MRVNCMFIQSRVTIIDKIIFLALPAASLIVVRDINPVDIVLHEQHRDSGLLYYNSGRANVMCPGHKSSA